MKSEMNKKTENLWKPPASLDPKTKWQRQNSQKKLLSKSLQFLHCFETYLQSQAPVAPSKPKQMPALCEAQQKCELHHHPPHCALHLAKISSSECFEEQKNQMRWADEDQICHQNHDDHDEALEGQRTFLSLIFHLQRLISKFLFKCFSISNIQLSPKNQLFLPPSRPPKPEKLHSSPLCIPQKIQVTKRQSGIQAKTARDAPTGKLIFITPQVSLESTKSKLSHSLS